MKAFCSIGVVVAAMGVAAAGTPPAIEKLLSHAGGYYTFDGSSNQWLFAADENVASDELGCAADFKQAAKDGVADTLSVDVPFDTPDWKRGPHTVAELKAFCNRARRSAMVKNVISGFKLGKDDDRGDLAAKCIQWYEEAVNDGKVPPTTKLPFEGIGADMKDPATGNPFAGTLEEGRKKFCDPNAKEYLDAKAKDEAPYRKVLKGAKLEVAIKHTDIEWLGAGGKKLTIPQMGSAKVWFRHKWYKEQHCNNSSKITHAVERYTFDAKGDYDSTQKDYCGEPPSSAYK